MAIGLLALVAVLPEYAVDMYFAWTAGKDPSYISYAAANMTGGNRLIIGIAWPAILLAIWWKRRETSVRLTSSNGLEILALLAATFYSFIIPLKGTLSLMDFFVLGGIFLCYAVLSSKNPVEEPELDGPALLIACRPKLTRRLLVVGLFALAALAIYSAAEPFAEGLIQTGRRFGIEEFLLVQWLAPLASEAPEFIVAVVFALKGKPGVGMRALISSKINQWTLLVGMLPAVYCVSAGNTGAMHLDPRQIEEIFLTSAQSLLAMVMLLNLNFTALSGLLLFSMFITQIFFPGTAVRYGFAAAYLALAAGMLLAGKERRVSLRRMIGSVFSGK